MSKTKCLFMCGSMTERNYPAPLRLNNRVLPFVTSATHLGHELSQDASMDQDTKVKRAGFIDRSTNIRETFAFADPQQVIRAVETSCCDHYGSMLWRLYDEPAAKYFRCWNTLVKLVFNVTRQTHTYLVTDLLAAGIPTIRTAILARYVKFVRSLLGHESPEVSAVANYLVMDRGSTTGVNVYKLEKETGLNVRTVAPARLKEVLLEGQQKTPPVDCWRKPLLQRLLAERRQMELNVEDTKEISDVIDSLCKS